MNRCIRYINGNKQLNFQAGKGCWVCVFIFFFFLDQLFSEAVLPENEIRQLHEYVIFSTKEPNVLILLLSTMTMK